MKILVFGRLTDIVGSENIRLEGVTDTDGLLTILAERFPALQQMKFMIAVDRKQIVCNTRITEDSMIVLMPPFSGG